MYNGNFRADYLDYMSPGVYMITLRRREEIADFSRIIRNDGRFNTQFKAISDHTPLGQVIRFSLEDFQSEYKALRAHSTVFIKISGRISLRDFWVGLKEQWGSIVTESRHKKRQRDA